MTSPDGVTWTARSMPEALSWYAVTYGDSKFVAVGAGSGHQVMTSPDGITWTGQTAAEANSWKAVKYGDGKFVALASTGANRGMYSTDAITWTPVTTQLVTWTSLTYAQNLFVATSSAGSTPIATSSDGITWVARYVSPTLPRSVTYGDGRFVAVGTGTNRVSTSPDGLAWTSSTAAAANTWTSVIYGGQFVAVSSDGTATGNRVMTAPGYRVAVYTGAATPKATSATVSATVNAAGQDTTALSIKYSSDKATVDAGDGTAATTSPASASGSSETTITGNLTGLNPGTTYYYRVSASNSTGTATGATRSFTAGPTSPQDLATTETTLTWAAPTTTGWFGAPSGYIITYKKWADRANTTKKWAVLAARASNSNVFPINSVPTSLNLTEITKNNCGTTNTTNGWGSCPAALGPVTTGQWALAVQAATPYAGSIGTVTQYPAG